MNSTSDKYIATCLWIFTGMVIALELRAQPSLDILNQLENYNSSTCQIVFNGTYTCSGVLINNTQDRGRPLILTAAHCIESEEDLNSIVVIFGKRKLLKSKAYDGLKWSSNAGASLLAFSQEIDFALLELKSRIPVYVSPVYLGWNKVLSQPTFITTQRYQQSRLLVGFTMPLIPGIGK